MNPELFQEYAEKARDLFTQSGVNQQMKDRNVLVNAGGDVPI